METKDQGEHVYSRRSLLHLFFHSCRACDGPVRIAALAQAPATPPVTTPAVQASTAADQCRATAAVTIHGHITDQTGALIPGAKITIEDESGKTIRTIAADASGAYEAHELAPGSYIVKAEYNGFAPFQSQPMTIAAGQAKRVDIAMAIQVERQNVVVTDESPTVNVEASGNSNAIVLKGKDLDALSDDPDELSNELQALAGPSAGPNGGQIFIDGFSGGQLPPKSAIREIRINQNPFSAEFDRLGYGRIEIFTKPGTDKFHGQAFVMGNDQVIQHHAIPSRQDRTVPSYYSYQFNGTMSGAINKNASFFVSGERRHIGNIDAWLIPDAMLPDGSGTYTDIPNYGVNLLNVRHAQQHIGAHRLAARSEKHADRALWFLVGGRDRRPECRLVAFGLVARNEHRSHAADERCLRYQRPHGDRDPLPVRAPEREPLPGFHGAHRHRDGRHDGGRPLDPDLSRPRHAARVPEPDHALPWQPRHQVRHPAARHAGRQFHHLQLQRHIPLRLDPRGLSPVRSANMENGLATGKSFNQLVAQGYGPINCSYHVRPSLGESPTSSTPRCSCRTTGRSVPALPSPAACAGSRRTTSPTTTTGRRAWVSPTPSTAARASRPRRCCAPASAFSTTASA